MNRFVFSLACMAGICLAAPSESLAQKKVIDHSVYDSWQSVSSQNISDDGSIASWAVRPQEGDAELVVKHLVSGRELHIERASRLLYPKDAAFGYCIVKAPFAATRQAKIDKKKADEMPKDSVALIDLKKLEIIGKFEASNAESGYISAPYIFIQQKVKDSKDESLLLCYDTATGSIDSLKNVLSHAISRDGRKLAAVLNIKDNDSSKTSTKYLKLIDCARKDTTLLSSGKEDYTSLQFNFNGDKLLFASTDRKEKTDGTPAYSLSMAREDIIKKASRKSPAVTRISVVELAAEDAEGLPEGWIVTKSSRPSFSNNSERIVLSLNKHFPAKDTTVVDFEAPALDIWNWDSKVLPPMNKARKITASRSAVINLDEPGKLVVLSGSEYETVNFVNGADGDFAISNDTEEYFLGDLFADESRSDIYRINLRDGSRTLLAEGLRGNAMPSPYGKWLIWFNPDDGDFYSISTGDGSKINLTAQTGCKFYDELDDHPVKFAQNSYPQWMGKDEYLLINDRYDVWKFSPDGKKAPLNLSNGAGRREKVNYSVTEFKSYSDPYLYRNLHTLPLKGSIELNAFGEEDSRNGFARISASAAGDPELFLEEKSYSTPVQALNADVMLYTKGDFKNPMDLYVNDVNWSSELKLTSINPQQSEYLWGDVQLVHWNAYDGTPLKGMLFTPENLDPQAKYPMIIYFYEKNAETLYSYRTPAPSRSIINIPVFVSQGYVVFVPDIVYTVGHPGESAYNCICSGAEAMCGQFSFINRDKMGIQGQSWGGYQTAYLVTRTDMFAAAGAGAPVGNMTSAYGGIRWESGSSRIVQYEAGQSRIGKDLWEEGGLDLYIENSPVFFAPKVKTPVLIMHNDNDGAVPWYQGIEFFMSLRRLGKPAWLLEYNNEAHNLSERRNAKDLSVRLEQFFDHYLKDEAAPAWMSTGIPYERKGNYFGYELAE